MEHGSAYKFGHIRVVCSRVSPPYSERDAERTGDADNSKWSIYIYIYNLYGKTSTPVINQFDSTSVLTFGSVFHYSTTNRNIYLLPLKVVKYIIINSVYIYGIRLFIIIVGERRKIKNERVSFINKIKKVIN